MSTELYKFFKDTTKRELFAMCYDMAVIMVGEMEADENPALVMEHLEMEKRIVNENNLVMKPPRRASGKKAKND